MSRPSVASATPSTAPTAVNRDDMRSIAATSANHQCPSRPAADPFARAAGRNDARNTICSAKAMSAARIPHAAVRESCKRTRRGSHVNSVVTVPARHSAPATDAPPINPPRSRKSPDTARAPSPLPAIHQSRITAGCVRRRLHLGERLAGRAGERDHAGERAPDQRDQDQHVTTRRWSARRISTINRFMRRPPRVPGRGAESASPGARGTSPRGCVPRGGDR